MREPITPLIIFKMILEDWDNLSRHGWPQFLCIMVSDLMYKEKINSLERNNAIDVIKKHYDDAVELFNAESGEFAYWNVDEEGMTNRKNFLIYLIDKLTNLTN